MEKLIRLTSNGICNLGYLGLVAGGGLTFIKTTEQK